MTFEYEVGKDLEALRHRVLQLEETLRSKNSSDHTGCCGEDLIQAAELVGEGEAEDKDGKRVRHKTFTFGRKDSGDCEWRRESITIYSNGRYKDIYEIKDHGTIFGDTFTTVIHMRNDDGHSYAKWQWRHSLSAKEELHEQLSGRKQEICDAFDQITTCYRRRNCSG